MATITQLKFEPKQILPSPSEHWLPTPDQLRSFANEANLIRPREDRGYSVYQVDQRYVYKRYHYPLKQRMEPKTRDWDIEHAVLSALSGHPGVPRSYGIQYESRRGEQVYHCLREYVPGEHLEAGFSRDQAADAGALLASLHMNLVTTNDPQGKNFISSDGRRLVFIDFGKASIFKRRTMLYYVGVARELLKFMYGAVHWDSRLWRIFQIHYFQGVDFNLRERLLIRSVYGVFLVRRIVRNWGKGKAMKD